MTGDSGINLYKLLGISDQRFLDKITLFMNGLCAKSTPADQALLSLENNKELIPIEKLYCSYAIGRMCALEEIKAKVPAPLRGTFSKLLGQ